MYDAGLVANHLVDLIQGSADQQAPGVVLGAALRLKFPGFRPPDYGCVNLKEFIEKHARDIVAVVGGSGQDPVYMLVHGSAPALTQSAVAQPSALPRPDYPTGALLADLSGEAVACAEKSTQGRMETHALGGRVSFPKAIWMSLSSIAPKYSVYANRSTGEMRLSRRQGDTAFGPEWTQVTGITRDDHERMARDFADSLPPELAAGASAVIGQPGRWWDDFFSRLEGCSSETAQAWKRFHNERTQAKILERLKDVGVPPEAVTKFYREAATSPSSGPGRPTGPAVLLARKGNAIGQDLLPALSSLMSSIARLLQALDNSSN